MNSRVRLCTTISILFVQAFGVLPAFAITFTDVPANHLYKEHIDQLSDKGIIKGNPDGTFAPNKTVNRAEILIMLYRAAGKNPAVPTKSCFSDVPAGEWYSAVVCDASKNGYVGGYPDGTFKPGKEVNRVESLKMIHTVLGLHVNTTASLDPLKVYTDLTLSAWYSTYLASAFSKNILPIAGQGGTKFYPENALQRGEAAAYIFNALGLKVRGVSSSATSSVQTRSSAGATSSVAPTAQTVDVDFPFSDDGAFKEKLSRAYKFTLQKPIVGSFVVTVDAGGSATCRLYKLATGTSFALEYYLGHVVDNKCSMRVSLGNGSYQFEVAPKTAGLHFTVTTTNASGDGNDGFREAMLLPKSTPKTGYLEQEDFAEWYYFKVTKQEKLTVTVSGDQTRCLIYPMDDVDLYGFSGPMCGEQYDFPTGTYYIGVQKKDARDGTPSFTIQVK